MILNFSHRNLGFVLLYSVSALIFTFCDSSSWNQQSDFAVVNNDVNDNAYFLFILTYLLNKNKSVEVQENVYVTIFYF